MNAPKTGAKVVRPVRSHGMSQEDFDRVLDKLVGQMSAAQVLSIPGVRDVLEANAELNSAVINAWCRENELHAFFEKGIELSNDLSNQLAPLREFCRLQREKKKRVPSERMA